MFNTDPDLSTKATDQAQDTNSQNETPRPKTEWDQFLNQTSYGQHQEIINMKLRGDTNEEIMYHFKSKQVSEEEAWLGVIQLAERERKILEKENRAARKKQKQLEKARELAEWHRTCPPEDLWQDQFTCNE